MTATELYKKYFPHAQPNLFQLEMIEAEITNMDAWNKTLMFWCGNDYRAQSVFKMLEYYKETTKAHVGANNYVPEHYDCRTCFDRKSLGEVVDGKFVYMDCPDCVGVKK